MLIEPKVYTSQQHIRIIGACKSEHKPFAQNATRKAVTLVLEHVTEAAYLIRPPQAGHTHGGRWSCVGSKGRRGR